MNERRNGPRNRPFRGRGFRGFTLIEVAAVIVLLALMVGAVRWTMADGQRAALLDDALDRVRFADRQARAVARRFDRPVALVIDLDGQTIRRVEGAGGNDAATSGPPTALNAAYTMTRVRTEREQSDRGVVAVPIGPNGSSQTYAIEIQGPAGGRTWVLVAGMSGQPTRIDDEQTIEDIFAALGPHAD